MLPAPRWPSLCTPRARYGGSAIVSTRIGGPPPHYAYVSRDKPVPHKFKVAKWAYITVRAPCDCGRANRAIWEATIVGAALRDARYGAEEPQSAVLVVATSMNLAACQFKRPRITSGSSRGDVEPGRAASRHISHGS